MIVTYSRNVFIPLTDFCRNNCYYCGFKKNRSILSQKEVENLLLKAWNATEALFTFGEKADIFDVVKKWLKERGFKTFLDYVIEMNRLSVRLGLLPHTNAGVLKKNEIKRLRKWNASLGLMLEQAVELECHRESPGKNPKERIKTIVNAGKLRVPFTTGILIGIGEAKYDREYSLDVIADIADNYGHIQEVIVQNFTPKKGTPMENWKPPDFAEMIESVRYARKVLPEDVAIQIPPNLVDDVSIFLENGANDLGGISEVTPDYINPEHPWPDLKKIESRLNGRYKLKERLPIYPKYVVEGWYSERIAPLIEAYSDEEGYRC
uniref:7,8-didemethyl-8-hydroxy-5-deazariboflavin synthase n=1 Tax=Geoglobus ahangari TaxID=113653 RepID=A0A7C3YNL0_9EURY